MTDRKILGRILHKAGIAFKNVKVHASVRNHKTGDRDAMARFAVEVGLDDDGYQHGANFYFDVHGKLLDISGYDNG